MDHPDEEDHRRMIVVGLQEALNSARAFPPGIALPTAAYTMKEQDGVILCDSSGGAFSVTLLTAVGRMGRRIIIKKIDVTALDVTVDASGSETIDGALTFPLVSQYHGIELCSGGANWHVIAII